MKNISIKGTLQLPEVNFNKDEGLIEISGRSIPEDATAFYEPLCDWLDEYVQNPQLHTTINFKMNYFNTSTSKWFLAIFKKFEILKEDDYLFDINWYYSDDDLYEYGDEIADVMDLPVNMISMEHELSY